MQFFFCILFFSQQNKMNDMTNTILDTFSVKYSFPHFTFLFNCSLQKQEQQIGGVATVHLSNLKNLILSINTRHALFKHCAKFTILKKKKKKKKFFFFFFRPRFLIANVAVRKSRSIISRLNRKCN